MPDATAQPDPTSATSVVERWRLLPNGRVRDSLATDADRAVAAVMHLWPLSIPIIGPFAPILPLVLWLAFRRRSPLVDDHGREVMNAEITILFLLAVLCVGWIALVPWSFVWLVSLVRGSVSAASGELFRYPMLLRAIQ
jgi:uncharacterized Tic20 family protein